MTMGRLSRPAAVKRSAARSRATACAACSSARARTGSRRSTWRAPRRRRPARCAREMALGSGLGGQAAPPDFARAQRERGHEAVAPGDVLAVRVLVVERALLQLEDADIGDGAGLD